MKTEVETLSPVKKRIRLEVPASEVDAAFKDVLRRHRRQVRLPGFRPGKAPLDLVRSYLDDELPKEAAQAILDTFIPNALEAENLRPVSGGAYLELDEGQESPPPASEGEPYAIKVTVEVLPELDVEDYEGQEVARPSVEVGAEEIQAEMERLRQTLAEIVPIEDRPSEVGDSVAVKIKGEVDGGEVVLPEDLRVFLLDASSDLPTGFREALSGRRVGDVIDFAWTHDEGEDSPLAGKTVRYTGEVLSVHQRTVPEWDDAQAAKFGDFDSVAALRSKVEESMLAAKNQEADQTVRRRILEKLVDRHKVEVPAVLVEREVERRIERIGRAMAEQGVSPEDKSLNWEEIFQEQRREAQRVVLERIILDAIIAKEKIEVEPGVIENAIARHAASAGEPVAKVRRALMKNDGIQALRNELLRAKCVDWLFEKAHIV